MVDVCVYAVGRDLVNLKPGEVRVKFQECVGCYGASPLFDLSSLALTFFCQFKSYKWARYIVIIAVIMKMLIFSNIAIKVTIAKGIAFKTSFQIPAYELVVLVIFITHHLNTVCWPLCLCFIL